MTDDPFFMWEIKNSKDPFPFLYSETHGKKTSLNNEWEKGLLRKESQCVAIELRGGSEPMDGEGNVWMDGVEKMETDGGKKNGWRPAFFDRRIEAGLSM